MRVVLYFFRNPETGLGHYYRMQALYQELEKRHHHVICATSHNVGWPAWFAPVHYNDEDSFKFVLKFLKPDWVVADLPTFPAWLTGKRLCLVNGIGHTCPPADLIISQGQGGDYHAPEYLLLRQCLKEYTWQPTDGDFVFGGGADTLGLLEAYSKYLPNNEAHLVVNFSHPPNDRRAAWVSDEAMLKLAANCRRAIVSTGMIVWELAALGVPTYCFSKSEEHLRTALWLDKLGLCKAYPFVGLPNQGAFVEFLSRPFTPTGKRPDFDGARRVAELLER